MAYATMYAFRKPFNAATYGEYTLWGFQLKSVLLTSQIIGYMLSKFIGIKVISELTNTSRKRLILYLILFAHAALLLFAIVPVPFKFVCLFLNGLPLGLVWGVLFSFVEGRKLTEALAAGIAIGAILSSGLVKSLARYLMDNPYLNVPEFWMPFTVGVLFLPLLLLSIWMLQQIPEPDPQDIAQKTIRTTLNSKQRNRMFTLFFPGILAFVLLYVCLTVFRDFRDNYAVEIMEEAGEFQSGIFAKTELFVAFIVLLTTTLVIFIKNNSRAFFLCQWLILLGFLTMVFAGIALKFDYISFLHFTIISGIGMAMGYVPFQIVLLERFVATFKIRGNVGFLMYLSDSFGYLVSVLLIFSGEFGWWNFNKSQVIVDIAFYGGIAGAVFSLLGLLYFFVQRKTAKNVSVI